MHEMQMDFVEIILDALIIIARHRMGAAKDGIFLKINFWIERKFGCFTFAKIDKDEA